MKHLSLTFLAIGATSAIVAATMYKKVRTDGHIAIEAAQVVEQAVTYRETVADTVWKTEYKVKYVYLCPPHKKHDAYFTDTSSLNLPLLGDAQGTKFVDSLRTIDLSAYIRAPKAFVFRDSNVYLAATVLANGIDIDSLSVRAKLSFRPVWKRNTAEIGITTDNPYITEITPVTLHAQKDKWKWSLQ